MTVRRPATAGLTAASLLLLLLVLGCPKAPAPSGLSPDAPRLVLFLVVDQARADYLVRFRPLLTHGFARLLEESVVFTDARHDHAITTTAPGHATLSTGRHPAHHGIVDNYWYDREEGEQVYAVRSNGKRTPERLLASTFGDWLKTASPESKVFAASAKDRAAILTAGKRADAAFWFDPGTGDFVTAPYYGEVERPWLDAFLASRHADRYFGEVWDVLPEVAEHAAEYGVEPLDEGLIQTGFPRPLGGAALVPGASFYGALYGSPLMDRYLEDFVEALIEGEELGADGTTDFLGVSFSALDSVGHSYGPDSPELLDTLLRLDRTLGDLLDFVDERIGLDHVLVSLSADHGVVAVPELLRLRGEPARRFGAEEITCFQRAGIELRAEFGDEDWIEDDLYLDWRLAEERGVELRDLEAAIKRRLAACPGVARVWSRTDLEAAPPGDPFARLYLHSLHPERSPDLFVQLEPETLSTRSVATSHGSPYPYDTRVPWLLRLAHGRSVTVGERVYTVDVAPTLAALIGLETPGDLDGVDRRALFAGP